MLSIFYHSPPISDANNKRIPLLKLSAKVERVCDYLSVKLLMVQRQRNWTKVNVRIFAANLKDILRMADLIIWAESF